MEEVKVKGKRGRKPRGEGEVRNVIEDPILNPYKIFMDDTCYTVVDKVKPAGALMEKAYGYYNTLGNALVKIAKLKMVTNQTYTLPEYVKQFEKLINDFKSKLDN